MALDTLDRPSQYPKTAYLDEAQFRRAAAVSLRDYAKAEVAHSTRSSGNSSNTFRTAPPTCRGWSRFKQSKLDEALTSFFKVLDLKAEALAGTGELPKLKASRAERELLEDTPRHQHQPGHLAGRRVDCGLRRQARPQRHEFRVYEQLGELYLKQERLRDAADTFGAFARRQPLHAQAALLQAV